jgi:accessory gene regulator B
MFIKQVNKFTEVLIDQRIITTDNRETINYGLSTGIELILNLITTLAIGLILDMVLESVVFVLSFAFIRMYADGYHLK